MLPSLVFRNRAIFFTRFVADVKDGEFDMYCDRVIVMDENVKHEWVTALRQGVYEQGKAVLVREDSAGRMQYCCLGVLCDIATQHGVISNPIIQDGIAHYPDGSDWNTATLPKSVFRWAGLDTDTPHIDTESHRLFLTMLNDDVFTFSQIADVIEWGL